MFFESDLHVHTYIVIIMTSEKIVDINTNRDLHEILLNVFMFENCIKAIILHNLLEPENNLKVTLIARKDCQHI